MGKINWDDLWPKSTPEEDEAFSKACADFDGQGGVSFKTLVEMYPRAFTFPNKATATKCILQLISGVGPDPELFQIASDLLVETVRPNYASDVAMRAAEIILDLRRELAKLKGLPSSSS